MACQPPIIIPPIPPITQVGDTIFGPVTWCDSTFSLALFVELININFQIIVECFEETFFETIELPGVPPITIGSPGLQIPGMDRFSGRLTSRVELRGQAHTGNRFPWRTGGQTQTPWEFRGFPAIDVPGGSITIPGTDPMKVVMEFTKINYEIIVEKMEERSLEPILDWSQFERGCDPPPDLNQNNQAVNDAISDVSPDGAPIGDSDVPDFGPGSGGVGSCWDINGGTVQDDGAGGFEVVSTNDGDSIELICGCAAEATTDGNAVATIDVEIIGNTTQGVIGAILTVEVWADANCSTLVASDTATASGSGGNCGDNLGTSTATASAPILAGQFATMRVDIRIDPPFVPCTSGSVTASSPSLEVP